MPSTRRPSRAAASLATSGGELCGEGGRARAPTLFEGAPSVTKEQLIDAIRGAGRIDHAELKYQHRIGAGGFGSVRATERLLMAS